MTDNVLAVTILRKETVYMHAESRQARDKLLHEFLECIDRAALRMSGCLHCQLQCH